MAGFQAGFRCRNAVLALRILLASALAQGLYRRRSVAAGAADLRAVLGHTGRVRGTPRLRGLRAVGTVQTALALDVSNLHVVYSRGRPRHQGFSGRHL